MKIRQIGFGVFESEMDEDELAHQVETYGGDHPAASGGPSAELLRYLTDEGLLKQGDRISLEYLAPGHFRIALPDFIETNEQIRQREQQRRERPRPAKPQVEPEAPPPPVVVDISCAFCDRNRSVIVDGVSYCKRHAREAGLGPTGKIT